MRQTIVTTNQGASIAIIQGAYENFCAPATVETVYDRQLIDLILGSGEPDAVVATQEDWLRFQGLVIAWRQERGAMSSITESVVCPAYQSILGMGPVAIPFLIATLRSEGDELDQWFWALKAITGADPVREEDRGDFVAMANAWLRWAEDQGLAG